MPRLPGAKPNRRLADRRRTVVEGPSEHQLQVAVVQWWALVCARYGLPVIALFACPNGGWRDQVTGARLKAEGVRPGAPDLILAKPVPPFGALFLEMKKPHGPTSAAQHEFHAYLASVGYCVRTAYGSEEAIEAIKAYLRP